MKKPPTKLPSGITSAPHPHSGWGRAARVTATKNRPIPALLLALSLAAAPAAFAQAPTPAQMMQQSAAATYQQQQQQQQALMGHIHSNIARCGDAHGHGCHPPAPAGGSEYIQWHMTGLRDNYGGLAVMYRDDVLVDNDHEPMPFTWEAYLNQHDINGKNKPAEIDMEKELDPINGDYLPYQIRTISTFRDTHYPDAESVAAALPKHCDDDKTCVLAAVYRNTCNAYAVGWLTDYSGVRIYTARRAYGSRDYGEAAYHHPDPEERSTAEKMVEAPIADALARCRSDPAVNPRTCAAPPAEGYNIDKYKQQSDHCALPKKTGRHY